MKKYKICSICGIKKNIEDFYKRSVAKDGRKSGCKACSKIDQDKYRKNNREKVKQFLKKWYDANIEHVKQYSKDYYNEHRDERIEYSRQYHEDNPEYRINYREENKEKIAKRNKEYRKNNKEKIAYYNQQRKKQQIEYDKKRYQENKESIKEQVKIWKAKNKGKVFSYSSKRRALKHNVEENFIDCDRKEVLEKFGNKCFVCCSKNDLTVDHHMPLSKGYALTDANAVVLCRSCNSKKGTKHPKEFYDTDQLNELENIIKMER